LSLVLRLLHGLLGLGSSFFQRSVLRSKLLELAL
jgi:hypothetical protein